MGSRGKRCASSWADIGVEINPKKITIGSLYDGFKFLGIFWKVSRDTGRLELTPPLSRQENVANEIHNVMYETLRRDPRDRMAVVEAVHDLLVSRTQYLRRAGASTTSEIGGDAFPDQLLRFADWWAWPVDQTGRCANTSLGLRFGEGDRRSLPPGSRIHPPPRCHRAGCRAMEVFRGREGMKLG